MAVIFPDIEKILVQRLQEALDARTEPFAANVAVSTIKPSSDVLPYPERMVVIRGDGGPRLDHVRKLERAGITIWCNTYQEASDLARLVEALVKELTVDGIKLVDIALSPVRVAEETQQECRYMTIEAIMQGTNL